MHAVAITTSLSGYRQLIPGRNKKLYAIW